MNDFDNINLRLSHPTLYRGIMTFAFINVALAFNFFFSNPTFNPYEIDKAIVGTIFLGLGVSKIIFLNVCRSLKIIRLLMALEIMFMLFWGLGNTITYLQGKTSLQLFVLYVGMATSETWLLLEPFVNPLTKTKSEEP